MAEHAISRNVPLPQAVLDADISVLWIPFWKSFHTLSSGRGLTGGMVAVPERIRYTDISAYARDFGFADSQADLEEFVAIIQAMDDTYVGHFAKTALEKVPPQRGS